MENRGIAEQELKALVARIKSGNKEAFRIIINNYEPLVKHIVFRMVRQQQDREDLCQDIFIKVFKNLNKFRFESKMSTWIGRISYNTCLNQIKKKGESLYQDKCDESRPEFYIPSSDPSPEEITVHKESKNQLNKALGMLSPVFKTALTLYHLENMSYDEICRIMNLPEGTVKSYIFRARQQMRTIFENQFQEEWV